MLIIQQYVELFDELINDTDTEEFVSKSLESFELFKVTLDDPNFGDNFAIELIRNFMGPLHRILSPEDIDTIALAYLKFIKMYIGSSYTSDSFQEMLSTAITHLKIFWASLDENAKAMVLLAYMPQSGYNGD